MLAASLLATLIAAAPPTTIPRGEEPLVDLATLDPKFLFDLRYATADNFFKKQAYPIARCALRKTIAARMVAAQRWLDQRYAGLRLMFKDCYRPDRVQRVLWDAVKGTAEARYVASPNTAVGSMHSYGAAVDVTLAGPGGEELDLGTPYDFLGGLAEPRHEARYLASGELKEEQVARRRLLRNAMHAAGMRIMVREWWHFDGGAPEVVRNKYSRLDVPLEAISDQR